jgi:hypothetical protein
LTRYFFAALLLATTAPLIAQPDYRGEPREIRSEVQIQGFHFDNFFQARGSVPKQGMNAAGFEYGVAYRPTETSPDIFGALYATNYSRQGTETSFGGRVGLAKYGSVHSIYGYLDYLRNGYSFDVGETRANANITSFFGSYSYRVNPKWQVGLNTYDEWGRFNVNTGFENDYKELEGEVRYRGFGRVFEPRVGYGLGEQDVRTASDSYDQKHWFVAVTSRPHPRWDLTARYRVRSRDYQNVDREEDRDQILLRAIFHHNGRLATTASFTHETVNSSLPRGDFDTNRLFAGFTVGF